MAYHKRRRISKNEVLYCDLKTSVITVNDVLEELSNENKRLLNELLFANKCLKSLINFKTFVELISNKFKTNLSRNEWQKFEKLFKDIEDVKQSTQLKDNEIKPKLEKRNKRKQNFDSEEDGSDLESIENNNSAKEVVECQLCLQLFMTSNDYKRHLKVHTNSIVTPFVCYIPCSRSFSSIKDLKCHSNECHSDQSLRLKAIKQNKSSIDSNSVSKQLEESLQRNPRKKLVKITENVVNDNRNNDNSDDGRHSDGFEDNDSNDSDYIPPETTPNVWDEELNSNDKSNSPFKQQNDLNSTQKSLELKTKSKSIKCQIKGCKQIFDESLSKQHFISVHKDSDLNCSVDGCIQTFKTYIEFVEHLKTHPSNTDQNELATNTGTPKLTFTTEMRDGRKYYICCVEECDKSFVEYSKLRQHIPRHFENHPSNAAQMQTTHKLGDIKSLFRTEIRDGQKYYVCAIENCDLRFANYRNLRQHILIHNRVVPKQRKVILDSKWLMKKNLIKCPIRGCNQTFVGSLSRKHLMSDHKNKLNCSVDGCNQTFKTYIEFITHLWTHPLYGNQCKMGKKFGVYKPLYKTEIVNGRTSYVCTVEDCGKRYSKYRSVYCHNLNIHKIKEIVVKCQSKGCDYEYTSNNDLLKHKESIHGTDDIHLEEEDIALKSKSTIVLEPKMGSNRFKEPVFETEIRGGKKYFICCFENCGKRFSRFRNVYDHYNRIHTQKRTDFDIKCQSDGCDYICHSNYDLMNHKKIIHNTDDIHLEEQLWSQSSHFILRKIMCDSPECEELFLSMRGMKRHFSKNHKKQIVCDYKDCGVVLNGVTAFNKHIKSHENYRIKCEWIGCEYECKDTDLMTAHKKRHTITEPIVCEICNKEYISKKGLKTHIKNIHTNTDQMLECDYEGCHKTFKYRSILFNHKKEVHNKGPKLFECDREGCSSVFNSKEKLKRHLSRVHCEPTIECPWPGCDYKAKIIARLREHEWVHRPEVARFVCEWPECDRTFRDRQNFKYHMNRHNNDKTFGCEWPGCDFRCFDHQSLTKHRQNHK